ncbi:zinc-ribbon domain-containing protein [Pelagibius sp. CAU 1746]|uniref:zinc-ribbon domain-containing protein n=1 Tax=Pelagibius sp. CAU 1746 TaxID=3140370 RepID=UPI00325B2617
MKVFECQDCGQLLFFENTRCEHCGRLLGYLSDLAELSALAASGDNTWYALAVPATCSASAPTPTTMLATGWCRRIAATPSAAPAG